MSIIWWFPACHPSHQSTSITTAQTAGSGFKMIINGTTTLSGEDTNLNAIIHPKLSNNNKLTIAKLREGGELYLARAPSH